VIWSIFWSPWCSDACYCTTKSITNFYIYITSVYSICSNWLKLGKIQCWEISLSQHVSRNKLLNITVLWDKIPCWWVVCCRLIANKHSVTSHKDAIFIKNTMQTWNYTEEESVHVNSCLSSVSKSGWKCSVFSGIQQKSGCKRPNIEHVRRSYHSVAGSQWGREDNNIVHVDRYVISA